MLVRQLIAELEKLDPELPVVAKSTLDYDGESTISHVVEAFFIGRPGYLGSVRKDDSKVLDALYSPETIHRVVFLETHA